MKIKIWGARGSLPSPLRPEDIENKICQAIYGMPDIDTSNMEAIREHVDELPPLLRGTAGGNTTCVEIWAGGELLVIDAGSGIRELGLELMKGSFGQGKGKLHLLFSHPHWDHILGFPFFNPAYVAGNQIFIYCIHDLEQILGEQQNPNNFPIPLSAMQATFTFRTIEVGKAFNIGSVRINTTLNVHPGKAYSFRFEDNYSAFVHASDSEYKTLDSPIVQKHIRFFKNADALIFDAQYTLQEVWHSKVDWGHSSAMIGTDLARAAGVKKLILFHHDPTYSDTQLQQIQMEAIAYQTQDTTRPTCEVIVAYEGLTLDLTPPDTIEMQRTSDGEATILTPVSSFDEQSTDKLAQQLAALAEQGATPNSVIDLSHIETLTTVSLRMLVGLQEQTGGHPVVLVGPSQAVRRIIKLGGYSDFFAIYPTVEAAVAAMQTRELLNLPGQVIKERYQIESKLGESPLGTLLAATDKLNGRKVAIKILSPALSAITIRRFMRQSKKLIQLNHPNIVNIAVWDQADDYYFRVAELVDGPTLEAIILENAGPMPGNQALEIAMDITRALEYAHGRGVIHGDLKPQNVFLSANGAKLSDFGLGRLEEGRNLLEAPLLHLTAAYLAPEQILGQTIDARTDLYALGIVLYQLFTGQLPFQGTDREIMQAHLDQAPYPPRELTPQISPSLEFLILKLLAKNPNDRYTSAEQAHRISSKLIVNLGDIQIQQQTPLVGRQQQQTILQTCWERARTGQGQLTFITGEAGIGKTSLAMQVATYKEPHILLIGHCYEADRSSAYHPFIEALKTYFSTVPPEYFDEETYQFLSAISHLAPEIRQVLPDLPVLPPLEPKQEQLRLMSNATQFIKRATDERPWLLILDDLHDADQSSLDLLRYLGHHLSSMALMIIGTYRDTNLARGHPLLETLRDLNSYATYHHIPLKRLNRNDTGELLSKIWQQSAPPNIVDKIYQLTEGNPTYVEEVARGLIDEGLITGQAGDWQFSTLQEMRLPQSIHEAVWNRIRHLTPDTQALLQQAAVLGNSFKFKDLQRMSGFSEWHVLEHLDAALEHQLIQEAPGENQLCFNHPEIQYVLYKDMGPLRRKMLHLLAGESLEYNAMPEPERIADVLAHHFIEAGEFERAIIYSIQTARKAQAAYANETAILWYDRALEVLGQLDPEEAIHFQSFRLSVNKQLGQILTLIGQYNEALAHFTSARALAHHQTSNIKQLREKADLCCQTAIVYEKRSEYDLAFEWVTRGLTLLNQDKQNLEMARLYLTGARLYEQQEQLDEAANWCQKSLDIAADIQSRESRQVMGNAYYRLGAIAAKRGAYRQSTDFGAISLHIFEQIDDPVGESNAHNILGNGHTILGNWTQAQQAYQKSLDIAHKIGDVEEQGISAVNLGQIYLHRGQWQQALNLFEQSLADWKKMNAIRFEAITHALIANALITQQDRSQAEAHLQRSKSLDIGVSPERLVSELEYLWSKFYLDTNEANQALIHAKHAVEAAKKQDDALQIGKAYRALGRTHLLKAEWEQAKAVLLKSLETLNNLDAAYEIAVSNFYLAQLSLHTNLPDTAQSYLMKAQKTFTSLNAQADLKKANNLANKLPET